MSLGLITPFPSYSLILSINTSIILAFSLTQIKCRASNYFTVPLPFPTQAFCLTQWQRITSQFLKRLRYFRCAVGMNLTWGDWSKPCEACRGLIISNYSAFLTLSSTAQTRCKPYNHAIVPLINRFLGVSMSTGYRSLVLCSLLHVNAGEVIPKGKFTALSQFETAGLDRHKEKWNKHH